MSSAQELDNQTSSSRARAELMRPFALKQGITMWCVKGNALLCEAARKVYHVQYKDKLLQWYTSIHVQSLLCGRAVRCRPMQVT